MIRTRFAPSPTGYLHVGGARTALFSWLYARKNNGKFILRIEDTDKERSTEESINAIYEGMSWLGLNHDEGPIKQTDRYDRYDEIIKQLMSKGNAYYCYCSKERLEKLREEQMANKQKPRYDGHCRSGIHKVPEGVKPVVRFRNPQEGTVIVNDLIRGKVAFNNNELDDLIIARSDGSPTYNLTVVVDDSDMNISCVIRGDDHLNNTPRQINILEAIGATVPSYAHVPMILGDDGKRLSKRHGAVSVMQYKADGYLPEALLNYLVRLGWSHGDQEIFSEEEMIQLFELEGINKAAAAFNTEKLLWLNQHYIKTGDPKKIAKQLAEFMVEKGVDLSQGPELAEVVKTQSERAKTLVEMAENSVFFYKDFDKIEEKAAKKHLRPVILAGLVTLTERLMEISDWTAENIHQTVMSTAENLELKLGKLAQPLRVAVTGGSVSPPIDVTLELIGKERVIQRLQKGIDYIKQRAAEV